MKVNPSKKKNHCRFLKGNHKRRRAWSEVFWALNENNLKPKILYPENYHSK
jgi:hypothetical protein